MPTLPTIVAIIAAYNEADIIAEVVKALIDDSIKVYLIDHRSTDDTVAKVERYRGSGLIGLETFPMEDQPTGQAHVFAWQKILKRKEELAQELEADWFIHHDADEFRESPWKDETLAEGIARVDAAGYNAIDFHVFDFKPTPADRKQAKSVRERLRFYEPPRTFDRLQIKCWKKTRTPVCLAATGGHEAEFEGRKVFPIRFLLRHYPIRSQAHGERKVLQERMPFYDPAERALGWHVQYDVHAGGGSFLHDPNQLRRFDPEGARLEVLLHHRDVERLEGVVVAAEAAAERLRTEAESGRQEAIARAADQEALHAKIREDADRIFALTEQSRAQTADAGGLRQRAETDASQIAAMKKGLEEYDVECRALRQRLGAVDLQVAGNHTLRDELKAAQTEIAALSGKLQAAETKGDALRERLRARQTELEDRNAELVDERAKSGRLERAVEELGAQVNATGVELEALGAYRQAQDLRLDGLRAERARLLGDVQSLQQRVRRQDADVERLWSETEHLSSDLAGYRSRLAASEAALASGSRSWSLTRPLRAADGLFRRRPDPTAVDGHTAKRESLPVTSGLWLASDVAMFWDDRWAGPTFEFELGVGQSISGISVSGFVPAELPHGQELRLKIDDREWTRRLDPGPFGWTIAIDLRAHTSHKVLVSAANSWRPSSTGAPDDTRELAWQVIEISGRRADSQE